MAGLSRKKREKERHKREIIAAAEKVFAKHGFHKASMAEIAKLSEFAVGTLYNFFPSKEVLYTQVVRTKAREIDRILRREAAAPIRPREKLERLAEAMGDYLKENRDFFRLFITETRGASWHDKTDAEEEIRQLRRQHIDLLAEIFEEWIPGGRFATESPYHLALFFLGGLGELLLSFLEDAERTPISKAVSLIRALFPEPKPAG
jgi:AcrR family transcriptional regulator